MDAGYLRPYRGAGVSSSADTPLGLQNRCLRTNALLQRSASMRSAPFWWPSPWALSLFRWGHFSNSFHRNTRSWRRWFPGGWAFTSAHAPGGGTPAPFRGFGINGNVPNFASVAGPSRRYRDRGRSPRPRDRNRQHPNGLKPIKPEDKPIKPKKFSRQTRLDG